MALNINGRMKVKTLRADFKKEFGLSLRVYDGRSFADEEVTLASIRKGDSKGGEFSPQRNTKLNNIEDKIMDMFGIKTQVSGSDDSYLCNNAKTLAGALEADEKLMIKRVNRESKADTEDVQVNDDKNEEEQMSIEEGMMQSGVFIKKYEWGSQVSLALICKEVSDNVFIAYENTGDNDAYYYYDANNKVKAYSGGPYLDEFKTFDDEPMDDYKIDSEINFLLEDQLIDLRDELQDDYLTRITDGDDEESGWEEFEWTVNDDILKEMNNNDGLLIYKKWDIESISKKINRQLDV